MELCALKANDVVPKEMLIALKKQGISDADLVYRLRPCTVPDGYTFPIWIPGRFEITSDH